MVSTELQMLMHFWLTLVVSTIKKTRSTVISSVVTSSAFHFLLTEDTLKSLSLWSTSNTCTNGLIASRASVPPTVVTSSNDSAGIVASLAKTGTTSTTTMMNACND